MAVWKRLAETGKGKRSITSTNCNAAELVKANFPSLAVRSFFVAFDGYTQQAPTRLGKLRKGREAFYSRDILPPPITGGTIRLGPAHNEDGRCIARAHIPRPSLLAYRT